MAKIVNPQNLQKIEFDATTTEGPCRVEIDLICDTQGQTIRSERELQDTSRSYRGTRAVPQGDSIGILGRHSANLKCNPILHSLGNRGCPS
jgi:hypothetical protein